MSFCGTGLFFIYRLFSGNIVNVLENWAVLIFRQSGVGTPVPLREL